MKTKEPPKLSLYQDDQAKDSCGFGFVANIDGRESREIIDMSLESIARIDHRGAVGADPESSDGTGILLQIPDAFFRRVSKEELDITLPEVGRYGVGFFYLPIEDDNLRFSIEILIEKVIIDEGLDFLAWRDVPTVPELIGESARRSMPLMRQCFVGATPEILNQREFEKKLYLIRRVIDRRVRQDYKIGRDLYYVASFSSRTIVYKGMLTGEQLKSFYPDLQQPDMHSALTLIHQRYSTNTVSAWNLAQPFRYISHNGEINTIRGNQNWMKARQMIMKDDYYQEDLKRMLPIVLDGQSDSASFDLVLELLYMCDRPLVHSIMMMIPEAWTKDHTMSAELKAFYQYHSTLMEPWDGPIAMAFTNGIIVGATLDRNGLRPGRYTITKDNLIILASEAGTIDIPTEDIRTNGRLKPGHILLVDTHSKRIISDQEIKQEVSHHQPYKEWVKKSVLYLPSLKTYPVPKEKESIAANPERLLEYQRVFSYTKEVLMHIIRPMVLERQEPIGAMGDDTSLAILSKKSESLFRYFKQQFAQVTNPAIDPIREKLVMELNTYIGGGNNILIEVPEHAHCLELEHPILSNKNLEQICNIKKKTFLTHKIDITFPIDGKKNLRNKINAICEEAIQFVQDEFRVIVLSDLNISPERCPLPSLLAVSAVHHALIKEGLRTKATLIIETGEACEVTHFAALLAYGAQAINPYIAFASLEGLERDGLLPDLMSEEIAKNNSGKNSEGNLAYQNYIQAISKGLYKIFSKMGISTLNSYCGAQIFEIIGLDSELVNLYFTGTKTLIEGLSLEMLGKETLDKHRQAYQLDNNHKDNLLPSGGLYLYRKRETKHLLDAENVAKLRNSTRTNDYDLYKEFAYDINDQPDENITLRSMLSFIPKNRIPLSSVEPIEKILRRFNTGAMSFGSISWETHTDLAIAMNRIGGKSNTGEGGEDPKRYDTSNVDRNMRSAIKQVASGRFGVTAHYLVNADDIQIKIAQGAKPGEGGQLPGFKVDGYIAKLRYSTPGVTLISPPPHHDIYSIEDLKQLIFDLKNINPKARISVKLVSEHGVGTVAAGVAKAHADHILISGHDGGTGASPMSSMFYTGTPWELGLSETQQSLVMNGLRDRVYLAVDGKMLTGRDVVVAALLGAEEFGFSIAPLISLGCIMMRKCHLNTCPVGITTQDKKLRNYYTGDPQYVVNYMHFVATEVREIMASLGFKNLNDMIGQVQNLQFLRSTQKNWKLTGLDFTKILHKPVSMYPTKFYRTQGPIGQERDIETQLDQQLINLAQDALKHKKKVNIKLSASNTNRSIGTMLAGEIARLHGKPGLTQDLIEIQIEGIAGQSFGAFINNGIKLTLIGQANDYVGKGLSGGTLIIKIPYEYKEYIPADENIIIGNTCLYGATTGKAFFEGVAGERFAVRNSGSKTVIEGMGNHGCEYMTGGIVICLGTIGKNFAAGMSGGVAYVWNQEEQELDKFVNLEMVTVERLLDSQDIEICKDLIQEHLKHTESKKASFILENWEKEVLKFNKIISPEYQKIIRPQSEDIKDSNSIGNPSKNGLSNKKESKQKEALKIS